MHAAPSFRSEFLRTFVARGAYYDCSAPGELDAMFAREPVTAYIGFDCTADSLHVGHMIQLMTLRRLQQAGHKPILLMGGGTTKVGDPSGKDETRQLLTPAQIEANKQKILASIRHLLKFGDGPSDAIMVDNAEWLDKLEYIPFLRLFTDLPEGEIARLETLQGAELNDAKKTLASEATAILHGREAAERAA
ncbi:MAG: tyrosine--tRNA ligase, partial [Alphaproteobacteria bacterium]|nr:tyrosine--tRNA ligase [Alphaproteobacteria bacterium]